MIGKKAVALTLAAARPPEPRSSRGQALSYRAWAPSAPVDPVDAVGMNTPAQDGCPIQSPDGLNLVHRVEPARQCRARSVGRTPGKHQRGLGRPGQPERRTGSRPEHERRRVLSYAGSRQRAVLRPQAKLVRSRRHLLHAPQPGPRLERARTSGLRARRTEYGARRDGTFVRRGGRGRPALLLELAFGRPGRGRAGRHLREQDGNRRNLRLRRVGRGAE